MSLVGAQSALGDGAGGHDLDPMPAGDPLSTAGALLRAPGGVWRDVAAGERPLSRAFALLAVAVALSAGYGVVIGLWEPGWQTLFAAAKLPIVLAGAALLCTPTLHVFSAIGGSRLTLPRTAAFALCAAASASLVLLAFAPIAWLFGVSSGRWGFMLLLHLGVGLVAAVHGLRGLAAARRYLAARGDGSAPPAGVLGTWSVLVMLVGLQLAWLLRPILSAGPFWTGRRGLFVEALGLLLGA